MSKQLRVLRENCVVEARAEGRQRWYALRPQPFVALADWLAPYRRLGEDRLDRRDEHLAARFPGAPESDLRTGGTVGFVEFAGDPAGLGEALALAPSRLLRLTWDTDVVTLELAPDGEGTELVLTNRLADRPAAARQTGHPAAPRRQAADTPSRPGPLNSSADPPDAGGVLE